MDYNKDIIPATVLHWNYKGFTEFPLQELKGEESKVTDIYLKENLITRLPSNIGVLEHLESLYLSGNDITELPKEISKLRCLKCLDVSGNRLRCVPDEIGEARSLKFLILDENELTELPLRIAELRYLRYLSVCDNKLKWLPQRPVYNYHHCEFRFWRNPGLKSLPFSLWYHMFRDQQTRSLNIGCLNVDNTNNTYRTRGCKLKLTQELEVVVNNPLQYCTIVESLTPPSLFEISKRLFYQMISNAVKSLNTKIYNYDYHSDVTEHNYYKNYNVTNLQENFEGINIEANDTATYDVNGNTCTEVVSKETLTPKKGHFVPTDIINDYFYYLPNFLKTGLCNGPISRCENISCRKPVFDFVYYQFCFGKIILIDKIEQVLLHAVFCSKSCAEVWKRGKITIPWTLT